jgi:branched-chain amino acid aminotransferase
MSEPSGPHRTIWIDGRLVPWEQATVHLLSHSLQRGSLVFDYMSVHETERGPAVFRLPDYVARLLRSTELVGLPLERDAAEVRAAILETVRANPGARSVKVCAFLPSIEVEVVPQDPRVSLAVAAYDPVSDLMARNAGPAHFRPELRVHLEKERRKMRSEIIPPQAKVAANYLSGMIAKWAARRNGYDEVLLVDKDGHLAEGPTENVFLVARDGVIRAPATGPILEGVTRRSILEIAKHDGHPVREESIRPEELFEAAEIFLTATTVAVWPVVAVDGRAVGDGTPGPISRKLAERFQEIASGQDPAFAHWLTYVNES